MDVKGRCHHGCHSTPEQAKIAEAARGCLCCHGSGTDYLQISVQPAVVSRMSDPEDEFRGSRMLLLSRLWPNAVIGHFVEASGSRSDSRLTISMRVKCSLLQMDVYHINKKNFKVPFCMCESKDLGEALRRINEGASMIRTKGEPGNR